LAAIAALTKLIHLDQEITILAYINAREEVIAMQHDEILEISIPIVKVWEGVITAPILGTWIRIALSYSRSACWR
jgi:rsbT co-antagonist protein RsbR